MRNFNPYLNCSDMLEQFIAFAAEQQITQADFMDIPISLFIHWLVLQAAIADGDDLQQAQPQLTHEVKQLKAHTHKCRHCNRFLSKQYLDNGIHFCNTDHMEKHMAHLGIP